MSNRKIALINGPNLNLLGSREQEIYGEESLEEIVENVSSYASEAELDIWHFQSNSEGELVDAIQKAKKDCVGLIINPGAYSHYSIAIRDALANLDIPKIEVHISNIYKREEFRHNSVISPVCSGVIAGLGSEGYLLALGAIISKTS